MDELQQHGLLVPKEDRAIWLCSIKIGDWEKQLTCLRFDADQIWSDPSRRPDSMDGSVEPVHPDQPEPSEHTAPAGNPCVQKATQAKPDATSQSRPSEQPAASNQLAQSDSFDGLPLPFDIGAEPATEDEAATANKSSKENRTGTATAETCSSTDSDDNRHPGDGQVDGMDASEDAGKRFLAWLTRGIHDGSMKINAPNARIHVLPEGLALVSPRIFRDFDTANWSHAQKRFF
ncbi:MAG: DNA-binding domain-containing protein [Salinisphaera sp.]|jgi:hypothetical protein|nr:DNA-binding domain-containing protein [Salinisphaera sp.]